ncbi:MAG: hypothetical protein J1G38_06590 [Clostridiales bacterium]|nr:hypothetical protein [Clostridiales bacterium]
MEVKRLLCFIVIAALLGFSTACGGETAKQKSDGADFTKGYFAGLADENTVAVDLRDYVDANGTKITYTVRSDNEDVVTAEVKGDTLTATVNGAEGSACITVGVKSNGKKAFDLFFTFTANVYERVACIGDSLTYGHAWHDQSYPVYLQELLGDIEVKNFGYNGASVTDRSTNYNLKYSKLKEYADSLAFKPDIAVIMLGSNDGWAWKGSEPTFEREYKKLIDAYFEAGAKEVFLLTAPPTLDGNAFDIPNDILVSEVCPTQRRIADEYGLPLVDVREAFEAQEDLNSLFRPGDGVHFSVDGAKLVASLVKDALVKL